MKQALSLFLILLSLAPHAGAQTRVVLSRPAAALHAPAASVSLPASGVLPSLPAAPSIASALSVRPAPSTSDRPALPAPRLTSATKRLQDLFSALDAQHRFPASSPAAVVRTRVREQLLSAARDYSDPEHDILETVARETDRALVRIQERLDRGEIDPSARMRLSEADPVLPADPRRHQVAVYPVAADPFQWGHLIIALRAVGDLGVDKVVFVLAGDDPRKPTMTPVLDRHPMGREVLNLFAPFFEYSPIAVGTTLDGETNIMRILALNRDQSIEAWYMVGDDHYRLVDKHGNPDTLPKLERNYRSPMGHNEALHQLKVAFIERDRPAETVPTDLEVRFLPHVGFPASSTDARKGKHSLMPHAAYDYARRARLYGLAPEEK